MKVVERKDEPARGCFRIGDGRYKIVYWDDTACYISAEEARENPVTVGLTGISLGGECGMKKIEIISDYTPLETPNKFIIIQDDQGDIHISTQIHPNNRENNEKDVRIAASGTRYPLEVRKAFYNLVKALERLETINRVDQ